MQVARRWLLCGGWLMLAGVWAAAQRPVTLRVLPSDQTAEWLAKQVDVPQSAPDSMSALAALTRMVGQLRGMAYLEASADTVVRRDSVWTVLLHVGGAYQWASLSHDGQETGRLSKLGFQTRHFRPGNRFDHRQVTRMMDRLLAHLEDHGHPFARVWLDSIQVQGQGIAARLRVDKGPLIVWEGVAVEGDAGISKGYLARYLGILPGEPYNRTKVMRLRSRLLELPFVKAKRDPIITFLGHKATVNLFLERQNASRFNFLIGVLPNSSQVGRLLVTGAFDGDLHNQFGAGERIFAKFEQLRPQTQALELAVAYPFLLNSPVGVDAALNLYKRDTNFLNVQYNLGLHYALEEGSSVRAFWHRQGTTLLSIDTRAISQRRQLPDTLDISRNTFGLEYLQERLDYRHNPRRGWSVAVGAGAGTKQVRRNNLIDQLDVGDLYADVPLRSAQYRLHATLAGYVPVWRRITLKVAVQAAHILATAPVYANEQYRIGGNRLLRGFDEEFIFATGYAVSTVEWRLLTGRNSFLYAFADMARVDDRTASTAPDAVSVDFPYGFGAGITFETRAGLFGFSLAVGSRRQTPLDLGAPKVHLGYVSLF